MGKCTVDNRDNYYRKAKEEGYRARSAYKLLELDDLYSIFQYPVSTHESQENTLERPTWKRVKNVCDLCAAPGSWSQVCASKLLPSSSSTIISSSSSANCNSNNSSNSDAPKRQYSNAKEEQAKIVCVDIQRVAAIPGVIVVQGDITSDVTIAEILSHYDGAKADLVLCDGASELGCDAIDEVMQAKLNITALKIACKILAPGGTFVTKVLKKHSYYAIERKFRLFFSEVQTVKPKSSRPSSSEHFAVCKNFHIP